WATRADADPDFWLHYPDAIWNFRLRPGQHRRSRPRNRSRLPRLSRYGGRGRGPRIPVELSGRASFYRLEPGFGDADAADRTGDADDKAAARHRRHRAALAQSGAARRAGRDIGSDLQRPLRLRHRPGIP